MADLLEKALADAPGTGLAAMDEKTRYWLSQIKAAEKRTKKWRDNGKEAVKIYEGADEKEEKHKTPFNILYSNTETLAPAIYNEPPVPVVGSRYKQEDPLAALASQVLERTISFTRDNPMGGYDSLHDLFASAVLAAAVPGLGVLQFAYDADIKNYGESATNEKEIVKDTPEADTGDVDGQDSLTAKIPASEASASGSSPSEASPRVNESGMEQAIPEVKSEAICARLIPYDMFLWGYAKRWKDTPWRAVAWDMTRADVVASFGEEAAKGLPYSNATKGDGDADASEMEKRAEGVVRVWEIWHKSARSVIYLCEGAPKGILREDPDPLGLSGFFNIPDPLVAFQRVSNLVPQTLYQFYRKQAEELNSITVRIEKITNALKVRGFYDSSVSKMADLFSMEDNVLLPADGVNAMQNGGTLDKAIWLMPVDMLANVLNQLLQNRQQIKQVIYEITGISDILRGSSVASETATAQNIKNQWGSLRLKKFQKAVQNYVRECFRMIAEIAGEHFSEETFAAMTGLPIMPTKVKADLQAQAAQLEQQIAMEPPPMPAQPPQAAAPGQPPGPPQQPPPPSPQQQQLDQIKQQLQTPSWGEVLPLLQDDVNRAFKVDIETDSTIDPEATEDRTAFSEMLGAVTQVVQQWVPAVQQGILSMQSLKAILKGTLKRFRFGPELDQAINSMPDQPPQAGGPEAAKQQQEMQKQQEQLQKDTQALEQQKQELAMAAKTSDMEKQMALKEVEMARKALEQEKQMALQEIDMKKQQAMNEIKMADQQSKMQLDFDRSSQEQALKSREAELLQGVAQRDFETQQKHTLAEGQRKADWATKQAGFKGEQQLWQQQKALQPAAPGA